MDEVRSVMSWFRRSPSDSTERELREANVELGDKVHDLRRRLADAAGTNDRLAAANEQLTVDLERATGHLSHCTAERWRAQALAASAEKAAQQAEDRMRRAMVILAQPGPDLAPQLIEEALRVLQGDAMEPAECTGGAVPGESATCGRPRPCPDHDPGDGANA